MADSGTLARVVFDEAHNEAWTIRAELARHMQPAHPGDASYARAAAALAEREFVVAPNVDGPLTAETLRGCEVLVIAHPSDPAWERTTGIGSPRLSDEEVDAVERFVAQGGGLIVLGETEQEKYGNNLNALLARFGLHLENDTVQDYEHCRDAPTWILADLLPGARGRRGDLLARVNEACLYRATTISATNGAAVLARTHATASAPSRPLMVATEHGQGRVVVLADSDLFDGDHDTAHAHLEKIIKSVETLAPRFPHDAEYLSAVIEDLRGWDFGKPDFTRALGAFRPELQRVDGIEHLVVFPMYKQNGSRDTCFEALIVRGPWPDWIAEVGRPQFDNPKFVPVELIDATAGYDSDCAVLFPETVSVAGRPVSNFGAIFCDRESERLRGVAGDGADLLRLNLPPDGACMLASPAISQQAYIMWDLIHDRNHSHGDLPFDPFMIRQRAPHWMYSLEELRCDLTTFGQAVQLEAEGVSFARYVQYAILLDRLLRFPITGSRMRNYDGLGGQLLFAYLHRHGYLHWTDNQLTIEWDRVVGGVAALRNDVEELYRRGIDRTKLQHWTAAHDLVASSVPPATGSKWSAPVRDFTDVEDPRSYIDLVRDDEFPLSIFYSSLKDKLAA